MNTHTQKNRKAEIVKSIRAKQKSIATRTKRIREILEETQQDVEALTMLFDIYKESTKKDFLKMISEDLNIKPSVIQKAIKDYRYLTHRKKIDKSFLETVNVLERSERKNPTKKPNKSPLLKIGGLCGNVREIHESGLIKTSEKALIVEMLDQLKTDLLQ